MIEQEQYKHLLQANLYNGALGGICLLLLILYVYRLARCDSHWAMFWTCFVIIGINFSVCIAVFYSAPLEVTVVVVWVAAFLLQLVLESEDIEEK